MIKILACAAAVLCFSSTAFAECTKTANGQTVCQGQSGTSAAGVNPNTGNAVKSQKNDTTGVTTTQTSRGGTAKTKNGKGVVTTPGGKTCARTANQQGCN